MVNEYEIPTSTIDETEYFGDKPLRYYQVAARNATIQYIKNGAKRILIELPTGAGKTITVACTLGSSYLQKALNITEIRPTRVLFVAHKHRLLTQAEQTFALENNVQLITQSMFSIIPDSVLQQGWDICVLDESHHEATNSFQVMLETLGDFPIIGLTATSQRADGCLIKFDHIINPISREQAVLEGYLAPTNIHTFVDIPSKDKIAQLTDMFSSYHQQMGQAMVFVRTKKEVQAIATMIQSLGYSSEQVVGVLNQSEKQLNTILDDFSAGVVKFIVNCNKINEGVDVKGCTDVVLGRSFGSYAQLNQVIGRASRPDSPCNVWELINPLSGNNMDTTVIVGTPESHRLINKERGEWVERQFDYVTHRTNKQLGISQPTTFRH